MSVHISSAVWKLHLDPTAKLILLKLADCADDRGMNARPSIERIAHECCVSESTARRALKRLRDDGLLAVVHRATQHRPTVYQVVTARGIILRSLDLPARGVNGAPRDLISTPRDLTAVTPDPSIDPSIDPSSSARTHARDHDDKGITLAVQRAVSTVRRTCGSPSGSIRLQIADMLLAGVPPAWFGEACDAAAEQGVGRWAYVRAILEHWRKDGRDCVCRRPGGGSPASGDDDIPSAEEIAEAESWGRAGVVYSS